MSVEKLKDKAKALEAKNPKAAIPAWEEAVAYQEQHGDPNPDITMYNKLGDLYLKVSDPAKAADAYERAVDRYAELGFHNNAIAMCNKVLRNAPGRTHIYLKLAKLFAAKGFLAEAKQHFLDYAGRMNKAGRVNQAVAALKEFTDISPEADELRDMLLEHLKAYGGAAAARRPSAAVRPPMHEEDEEKPGGPKRKTSSLVFLDLDAPAPAKKGAPAAPPPRTSAAAPAPPAAPAKPKTPSAEDASLVIESTSLADEPRPAEPGAGMMAGLETTLDFGSMVGGPGQPPALVEEPSAPEDVGLDIEPVFHEEEPPPRPPPPQPKAAPPKPVAPPPKPTPKVGPPPRPSLAQAAQRPSAPAEKPPEPAPPPPRKTAPVKRPSLVELPPLELEPDFETSTVAEGPAVDDQPLDLEESGRGGARLDVGAGDIIHQEDQAASIFADLVVAQEAPAAVSIEDLETQVADNPDDLGLHRQLGEALIEAGKRERGIEELDIAASSYEAAGEQVTAEELVDEILRLDPNSVRHRQKQVEFAYKVGDKQRLIDAYLELADALLRGDVPEKAMSVYQRVAEHDPGNKRAQSALAMLAPARTGDEPKKATAKDAKMKVRDDAEVSGDFVDLGALILEEEKEPRDTRMKVADEEPTGDEEKDFQDMLARFRQGIEENIGEEDFQSHYDLGIAFKEMGLLDEAIAELQKALRASEGRLRTSEALGVCFFEKEQHEVAETILRRATELEAEGDKERLGILYWLGRAVEAQGKKADAKALYERVFAVDIRFQDVSERVKALAKAR